MDSAISPAEPVLIHGHVGLGDQIYMRPFIRALLEVGREIYLETAWPELYPDRPANLHLVAQDDGLRTQAENIAEADCRWERAEGVRRFRFSYNQSIMAKSRKSIVQVLQEQSGVDEFSWRMPAPQAWVDAAREALAAKLDPQEPFCVFKPPTVRREWACRARNPDPNVVASVCEAVRRRMPLVTVAWFKDGEEWPDCTRTWSDTLAFTAGELHWTTIAGMMSLASMVLCSPSFPVVMAPMVGTPCLCLFGGYVPPEVVIDPRMGPPVPVAIAPEDFCYCTSNNHRCNKEIPRNQVLEKLEAFLKGLS